MKQIQNIDHRLVTSQEQSILSSDRSRYFLRLPSYKINFSATIHFHPQCFHESTSNLSKMCTVRFVEYKCGHRKDERSCAIGFDAKVQSAVMILTLEIVRTVNLSTYYTIETNKRIVDVNTDKVQQETSENTGWAVKRGGYKCAWECFFSKFSLNEEMVEVLLICHQITLGCRKFVDLDVGMLATISFLGLCSRACWRDGAI